MTKQNKSRRTRLSRRAFLIGSSGVAVGIGAGAYVFASSSTPPLDGQIINAWLSIEENGNVQFACPAQEMGQGATMVLPMIVAEEMGADLARVAVIAAPRDSGTYGNPDFNGRMVTADSKTTQGYFDKLRLAGAEARMALIKTAAALRGWETSDCSARKHAVHHGPSGNSISFAEIAGSTKLHMPGSASEADFKSLTKYDLIGTSPKNADHLAIVTGQMKFGIDSRSKDALVAVLARCPRLDGTPVKADDKQTRQLPGVVEVILLDDAVAVVAKDSWSAIKGRDLLEITWTEPKTFDDETERAALANALVEAINPTAIVRSNGKLQKPDSETPFHFAETFYSPPVTHIALEPLNAEARGTSWGLGVSIKGSTQSQDLDMRYGAKTWKTAPFMVKTEGTRCGGAFGRRVLNDTVRDAAAISKAVGKPVQVFRPLSDEMRRGQVRPSALQTIKATADKHGNLMTWEHRAASDSVLGYHLPETLENRGGIDNTATDGIFHNYRVPNETIAWHRVATRPTPGFLRGVSAGYTVWAIETMVDRIARKSVRDPLEWRLAHIDDPRAARVLKKAAKMSNWGEPERLKEASGLAQMTFRGSSIATVARIRLDGDALHVQKLWIAADVGLAIHPQNVIRQIEGAALLGISLALKEQIDFKDGAADLESLADYPLLAANEIPEIEVMLVGTKSATRPNGVGEIGVPTMAPAIGNALALLSGSYPTQLPFRISAS